MDSLSFLDADSFQPFDATCRECGRGEYKVLMMRGYCTTCSLEVRRGYRKKKLNKKRGLLKEPSSLEKYYLEKEQRAFYSRKRRARKMGASSEHYTEAEVLDFWGTDCHLCGEPVDLNAPRQVGKVGWERGLHLEHVVSLVSGGQDNLYNVKPAHGLCNLKKPD